MPDTYTLSVLAFFAVLALVIYANRKKIKMSHGIFFMWRTKRFRDTIDAIAQKNPAFWRAAGAFAVVLCFAVMLFGVISIIDQDYKILLGQIKKSPGGLILPSLSSEASVGAGYILIPFWYWIIAVAMILVPHELMHGIFARALKIRLKSVGLLLLAIFPGAFVEPDERDLKKASLSSKLKVFAAGSFANFLTAAIFFLLSAFVLWPALANPAPAVIVANITEGGPAALSGLQNSSIITAVNGKQVSSSYLEFISGSSFISDEVGEIAVGKQISIEAGEKTFYITPAEVEGKPRIGFVLSMSNVFLPGAEQFSFLIRLFYMIWLFSFAVGVFNILPLHPLDGGLMLEAVAKKYFQAHAQKIVVNFRWLMIYLILFSFLPAFIQF